MIHHFCDPKKLIAIDQFILINFKRTESKNFFLTEKNVPQPEKLNSISHPILFYFSVLVRSLTVFSGIQKIL